MTDEDLGINEVRLTRELHELSEDIKYEDVATISEQDWTHGEENDDTDGLVDRTELLSEIQQQELLKISRLIQLALVKVGVSFAHLV